MIWHHGSQKWVQLESLVLFIRTRSSRPSLAVALLLKGIPVSRCPIFLTIVLYTLEAKLACSKARHCLYTCSRQKEIPLRMEEYHLQRERNIFSRKSSLHLLTRKLLPVSMNNEYEWGRHSKWDKWSRRDSEQLILEESWRFPLR